MVQMLAMAVERRDDWDVHLPHVKFAYNKAVSAVTGLPPNQVHMSLQRRFPKMIPDNVCTLGATRAFPATASSYNLATGRRQRGDKTFRE